MKNISKKIRILRLEKGWTQKKLAEKINLSQATICRVETNCDNIKWKSMIKILKALTKNNAMNLIEKNLLLKEDELFVFIDELKKNEKVWTLIHYDPIKSVKTFGKIIENFFKLDPND